MTLNIKSDEVDRLARELARRRNQSLTKVVEDSLRAELQRERARVRPHGIADRLLAIGSRYSALPVLDTRSDDEILGYDDMLVADGRSGGS